MLGLALVITAGVLFGLGCMAISGGVGKNNVFLVFLALPLFGLSILSFLYVTRDAPMQFEWRYGGGW